jgi:SAM-dependent methyltransferase
MPQEFHLKALATPKSVNLPTIGPGSHANALSFKREYWASQSRKFAFPHYRLVKSARLIRRLSRNSDSTLLDLGCGPATLMTLLPSTVRYHGMDIAILEPAPHLIEADFLESPINFGNQRFDIIVAQGVFEYMGQMQDQKLREIAGLLKEDGRLVTTYTNFSHWRATIFHSFSNVQSIADFRANLLRYFKVDRMFPASHNWNHSQPTRRLNRELNMRVSWNIPIVSSRLAVDYFFVCSPRRDRGPAEARPSP